MENRLSLLAALKRAHDEVLEVADAFEQVIGGAYPGAMILANVRLKLTVTNGRKRVLLEKIYAALGELGPRDAEQVRALRADAASTFTRASNHITFWTTQQMQKDWEGYASSCKHVPRSMRASVTAERRFLYPLLASEQRNAA